MACGRSLAAAICVAAMLATWLAMAELLHDDGDTPRNASSSPSNGTSPSSGSGSVGPLMKLLFIHSLYAAFLPAQTALSAAAPRAPSIAATFSIKDAAIRALPLSFASAAAAVTWYISLPITCKSLTH